MNPEPEQIEPKTADVVRAHIQEKLAEIKENLTSGETDARFPIIENPTFDLDKALKARGVNRKNRRKFFAMQRKPAKQQRR